ncbi:MAG: peptidase rane alanine aminopeptidase [Deltaproteobacteria bacterium]|nr:peptidase rane alanine aminopeptidase [Deltaproteobacteria bacterium]
MSRRAVVAALVVFACGRDHGAPRIRPLPKPDTSPAVRGGGPARSPRIANYKLEARLDVLKHQLVATETLTWTNPGESSVDRLPFHLYLNAFKNESSLFMRTSQGMLRHATASETGWGWIRIDSVQIGGVELAATLVRPHPVRPQPDQPDPDETVTELPLPSAVGPGQTIEVSFKFTAQLPEVFARTGYKGEFHLVGQWFPKVGVRVGPRGDERWECQPLHANTEFFADFGTYDVALTVPSTYVVAATGVLTSASEAPGGTRTFSYHAEDVHDFVWMADPYMEVMSAQAKLDDGTVEVRVVHRPEQQEFARRHLEAAVGAIERFSSWFVPYPWPIMTVVDPPMDAAMGAGGMEYPTLVTTAGDTVFARPGIRLPEMVTVHEVGHNWFQGMLASNEAVEAWLDEGVNEWADAKVMDDLYGPRTSGVDWAGWQAEIASLRRALAEDPTSLPSPIATAAYAFADTTSYGEATFASTMRALRTLEQTVGPIRFAKAMKTYAKTFAFKHPTGRDLIDTLTTELEQDLSWFFGPVFQQVGGVRFGIRTASCRLAHPPRGVFDTGSARKTVTETEAPDSGTYVCEVVVTNTGTVHIPVDLELDFADGTTQRVHWDDRGAGNWERFVIQRAAPLTEVWIDPDNKVWLDSPLKHHVRIEGDGSAALRAAAWFSFGAQTLLQIVGP